MSSKGTNEVPKFHKFHDEPSQVISSSEKRNSDNPDSQLN